MNAEVMVFNLVTELNPFVFFLLTRFMLSTVKSTISVYSFSFTLTGFGNSSAMRGLTGFTILNPVRHLTVHRCFWGLRFFSSENYLEENSVRAFFHLGFMVT